MCHNQSLDLDSQNGSFWLLLKYKLLQLHGTHVIPFTVHIQCLVVFPWGNQAWTVEGKGHPQVLYNNLCSFRVLIHCQVYDH